MLHLHQAKKAGVHLSWFQVLKKNWERTMFVLLWETLATITIACSLKLPWFSTGPDQTGGLRLSKEAFCFVSQLGEGCNFDTPRTPNGCTSTERTNPLFPRLVCLSLQQAWQKWQTSWCCVHGIKSSKPLSSFVFSLWWHRLWWVENRPSSQSYCGQLTVRR